MKLFPKKSRAGKIKREMSLCETSGTADAGQPSPAVMVLSSYFFTSVPAGPP